MWHLIVVAIVAWLAALATCLWRWHRHRARDRRLDAEDARLRLLEL